MWGSWDCRKCAVTRKTVFYVNGSAITTQNYHKTDYFLCCSKQKGSRKNFRTKTKEPLIVRAPFAFPLYSRSRDLLINCNLFYPKKTILHQNAFFRLQIMAPFSELVCIWIWNLVNRRISRKSHQPNSIHDYNKSLPFLLKSYIWSSISPFSRLFNGEHFPFELMSQTECYSSNFFASQSVHSQLKYPPESTSRRCACMS